MSRRYTIGIRDDATHFALRIIDEVVEGSIAHGELATVFVVEAVDGVPE